MILEKISNTKLKLTIRNSELVNRKLFHISDNFKNLKSFFVGIIKYAAEKVGFDTTGSILIKSYIQSSTTVFTITRLPHKQIPKKPHSPNKGYVFFVFENSRHLAHFLCAVKHGDFSHAYLYTSDGKYYLKLQSETRLAVNALEFSDPICSAKFAKAVRHSAQLVCHGDGFKNFF